MGNVSNNEPDPQSESPDYAGTIKGSGTIGPDPPRFPCLHIGLSTAMTVPPNCGVTRQDLR